ncbi:T9SS type A sorting domain-containing protein [Labilibaculum sp. K2S]|uniref:T9SS type A sorting domain-containing protein n=1 Tax=Labilibaculum sp. K2S TaxID=3056386 RepID=UPI0025A49513|nr:T9SS type A sorting domain-containing protein [Labilibaculum sp. K2S]MDM8162165.1 T9SS type A sorting domain-containing protein [Labilibaculum sp. K2S]
MKNIIITIFIILSCVIYGMSQNNINFAYDAAGNRVSRTINLSSTKSGINGGDAEKLSTEKFEDFFTEVLAEKEIKIFPNPTRGQLRVDILGYEDLDTNSSIQVFTTGGALLYKSNTPSQTNDINLSDKPAGLYLMVITIAGEKSTWKIIKQ